MKKQELGKSSLIVVLLLLWPICLASAVEPSPAGGGWLEVSKPGGYVFVEDHDDFDVNLADEFTLEMWIYLKRPPKFREVWILLHKEGSYLLTLSGHSFGPDGFIPLGKDQIVDISYYYFEHPNGGAGGSSHSYTKDEFPSNQWHHLTWVHGKNGYLLYVNGKGKGSDVSNKPLDNKNFHLYVGGTGIVPSIFGNIDRWVPFTGGFIDEVRVSNKALYPIRGWGEIAIPHNRFEPDENTIALWHFDGRRAEWLKDASGNGHTLTASDVVYYRVGNSGKLPILWGKLKDNETISR